MFCFIIKIYTTTSVFFSVLGGVRQSSILSPYLLNVYVNDLSNLLNNNNSCANHMFYANDLCVTLPVLCDLQALLNIIMF